MRRTIIWANVNVVYLAHIYRFSSRCSVNVMVVVISQNQVNQPNNRSQNSSYNCLAHENPYFNNDQSQSAPAWTYMINRKLHKSCYFSVYFYRLLNHFKNRFKMCNVLNVFHCTWNTQATHTHTIHSIYTIVKFQWVLSISSRFYFVCTPKWKRDENDRNRNYWICVNVNI